MASAIVDRILRMVRPAATNGNGVHGAPSSAEEITAALAELVAERDAAHALSGDLLDQHESLLLVAGSDAELAELTLRIDAAQLVVQRCDAAQPRLTAMLFAAHDASRAAMLQELRSTYQATVVLFAEAGRLAHRHRSLLVQINDTAQSLGFRNEAELLMKLPNAQIMVSASSLTQFESDTTFLG